MATVIKRDSAERAAIASAVRPVAFDFEDMARSREQYLQAVRSDAVSIIQEAHAEAKKIKQQAEAAGRAAAEGAIDRLLDEKVVKQIAELRPVLDALVDSVGRERAAWVAHWEQAVIGLAVRIAERILHRELDQDPSLALHWLRESLELVTSAEGVVVRVNDADLARFRTAMEQLAASVARLAPSQLTADPTIAPGGCRVETKFGSIDSQIQAQLARVVEELS